MQHPYCDYQLILPNLITRPRSVQNNRDTDQTPVSPSMVTPFLLCFSSRQPTQEELILQIFRRLAEDIHEYNENLPAPRKRQMVAALNEEVETMFAFLVHSLEVGEGLYSNYRSVVDSHIRYCPEHRIRWKFSNVRQVLFREVVKKLAL